MQSLDALFAALARSPFRSRFRLNARDMGYLRQKGLAVVMKHADDFIARRLQPARIANDGRQTPFSGHPVFVAQHATACCCRGCLQKWHHIEAGQPLDADALRHVHAVLERWLRQQLAEGGDPAL